MFEKIEILDAKKHARLKFSKIPGYAVAARTQLCLLGGSEIAEAAKYFPVLFPEVDEKTANQTANLPIALFSLKPGKNLFVAADGSWNCDYIPAHIRRYPFIFAGLSEPGNFALAFDAQAAHFKTDDGEPLFDGEGKATALVEQVKGFLGNFQNDLQATGQLVRELDRHGVLSARQLNLGAGDKTQALRGFRLVDLEKVKALDDATLAAWVRNGIMNIICAHLNSLTNLKKLAALQGLD